MSSSECKIVVGCRIRPLNDQEKQLGEASVLQCEGDEVIKHSKSEHRFDFAFDQHHGNNYVYEKLGQPIISGVLDGFHGTIFAYGQTSSGKTHTLLGVPEEMGIIVHSVHDIFDHIHRSPEEMEFLIRVSYLEIYNEEIRDLLNQGSEQSRSLKIVDDPKNGCQVQGLKEVVVISPDHVFQLLRSGEEKRHYGATRMNYTSSRSHTVFRLIVESRVGAGETEETKEAFETGSSSIHRASTSSNLSTNTTPGMNQVVQTATLNLVDLAGSERVSKTEATGARLKEGACINKSLLVLGTVINKLADGAKGHIPFRDSKLTRMLKNSIGGNAKTSIICTLSPAARNLEESKSTLHFASRAKTIVNKAKKNQIMDDSALIDQYRQEIAELKLKLAMGGSVVNMPELSTMRKQLEEEESKRLALEEKFEQEMSDHAKKKQELEQMRKLVLLTSKLAANPLLAEKMQDKVRCVANGEKDTNAVIMEVEDLARVAEQEEQQENSEDGDDEELGEDRHNQDKFSNLPSTAMRNLVARRNHKQKRRLSTLAMGIVASMAEQRRAQEKTESDELWRIHLEEKISNLQEENEDLRTRLHEFHHDTLNRRMNSVDEGQYRTKCHEVESLEERVADKERQVSSLDQQLKDVKQQLREQQGLMKQEEEAWERKEKEYQSQLRASESKALEVMNHLHESTQKVQELTSSVVARKAEIDQLRSTLSLKTSKERESAELLQEVASLKNRLAGLQQQNQQRMQQHTRELTRLNGKIAALTSDKNLLEKMNLASIQRQERELEQLLVRLEEQQKRSKEHIAAQEAQLVDLKNKLRRYESQISLFEQQNAESANHHVHQIQSLQSELEAKSARLEELEGQQRTLHNTLATEQKRSNGSLRTVLASLQAGVENIVSDMETKLYPAVLGLKQMESRCAQMQAQVHEMGQTMFKRRTGLRLERNARLGKMDKEQAWGGETYGMDVSQSNYGRERSLLSEMKALKETLSEMEGRYINAKCILEENQPLTEMLDAMREENETLVKECNSKAEEMAGLLSELRDARESNQELERKVATVSHELAEKSAELLSCKESIRCLGDQVEDALQQKEQAFWSECEKNSKLQIQLDKANQRIKNLQADLCRVKAEASQATETFLEYQNMSKKREGDLRKLVGVESNKQTNSIGKSKLDAEIESIRKRLGSSSKDMKSTAHQRLRESDTEELRKELALANKELDIFRRLDIYSTSLKRAMITTREEKKRMQRLLDIQGKKSVVDTDEYNK